MTHKETKALIENIAIMHKAKLVNTSMVKTEEGKKEYQDWLLIDEITETTVALIGVTDNILYKVYYTESCMLKTLLKIKMELMSK